MVFTDPPYNVPISGHVGGLGSIQHREFAMASGEMSQAEFTAFLESVFGHLAAYSVDGAIHFQCMDWRHVPEMLAAGTAAYTDLKNICVWAKTMAAWARSIARSMNLSSFLKQALRRTLTMSSWENTAGTAPMSGTTLG
jgi:hypothetical protein